MITVTEAARKKFFEVAQAENKQDHSLRVVVQGGGTWKPEFSLDFVAPGEERPDDTRVDSGGVTVLVDPESARWLRDASVDFVETMRESGFKVEAPHAGLSEPAGPVADSVRQVLEEQINPAVAAHGGVVSLVALEGDTAYLRFGGGCQGCGMINVTLKQGVERVLFEAVPQVTKVMDVTDHASGANPYYQPSK